MGTVNIPSPGGASYPVYGDLPAAKVYLVAAVGAGATAWAALVAASDDTTMSKLLVAAYRKLERQSWGSSAADTATRAALLVFQEAEYELAAIYAADPSIDAAPDTGSNVMILKAGPVEVEYFRPTSAAAGTASILPQAVMDLIGSYLSAPASAVGAAAYSSDCAGGGFDECKESSFTGCATMSRTEPF